MKILLKIIHNIIYEKCEESFCDTQFGFRNDLGTRAALFCFHVLLQRCGDVSVDKFIYFIGYEKAFDKVQQNKLNKILEKNGINFITNSYWNTTATVRVNNKLTKSTSRSSSRLYPAAFTN